MKECNYCRIEVGGNFTHCPLCHSKLYGEPTEDHWPSPEKLKKKSKLYKIQLLVVLLALVTLVIIGLALNAAFFRNLVLFIAMWVIIFEITLYQFVKRHKTLSGIFTNSAISVIIGLLLSTFWFPPLVAWIPIPLMSILGFNFFLTIFDRRGHVMVHFITFFFAGLISWVFIIILMKYDLNVLWNVCFLVSCATLALTLLIRGRDLIAEFQKRFIF